MRLLDLYCGAGGAAVGYHRAGFPDIVGVDIEPQPRYPFDFIQADALEYLEEFGHLFGVIHASPPCQAFSNARVIHNHSHPDLLTPTRDALNGVGKPWIIENVPNAPMRVDLMLCGSMFGLASDKGQLRRHRWFEFWVPQLWMTSPCNHNGTTISVFGHGGHVYHSVEDWRRVMGIDWMSRNELAQAIPPAFTQWIGTHLLRVLRAGGHKLFDSSPAHISGTSASLGHKTDFHLRRDVLVGNGSYECSDPEVCGESGGNSRQLRLPQDDLD